MRRAVRPRGVRRAAGPEGEPPRGLLGGGCTEATVEVCLAALRPAGHFVAHAVTLDTEQVLLCGHRAHGGGTLTRLAVETAEPPGSMLGWKPLRPVVQWSLSLP